MNFRVRVFEADERFISKFRKRGNRLGTFSKPKGIELDREGHIYVVDGIYDTVRILTWKGSFC